MLGIGMLGMGMLVPVHPRELDSLWTTDLSLFFFPSPFTAKRGGVLPSQYKVQICALQF